VTVRPKGSGAGWRRTSRALLALAGLFLLAAALTVPATLLLRPLWSWLDFAAGIEALGHSGPAAWCYLLVFAVLGGLAALWRLAQGRVRGKG
jgi:hypothetical protein